MATASCVGTAVTADIPIRSLPEACCLRHPAHSQDVMAGCMRAQGPAAAAGLIAGDGLWTIPSSILSICQVDPPICMSFQSSAAAAAASPPA